MPHLLEEHAMKLMTCPINGPRPVSEFVYWGVVRDMPDPQTASDAEWGDYVFNRDNAPGVKKEWWCHTPSNTWFIAERDTEKDVVISTCLYGENQ
ncbi:MAG: sarcosine oxidase subunit delta [Zoogloeaceae bacterium]|jgi:sarcosine oxidase subunit delta|nr:sarcosine oxidase subunit delta [Zoogloeaceae bacterium]